jgi:hypothetical protein
MGVLMTNGFMYVANLYFKLFNAVMPRILDSLRINSVNAVFLFNTEVECFTDAKIRIFKYW